MYKVSDIVEGEVVVMSMLLRMEMIVIAILFVVYIIHAVNKKKIRLQYSLIWILISIGVIFIAFFPDVIINFSELMKIETPTNLLYLIAILMNLVVSFHLTTVVSRQADKIQRIIQITSIETYLSEKKKENDSGAINE